MMQWRPYQWGDWEAISEGSIRPELIPMTRTLIDQGGAVHSVMGLAQAAPGTFEVFLIVRNDRATWPVYRELHREWARIEELAIARQFVALVDPKTDHGVELAKITGMRELAFLPEWWNGEDRILLRRAR